MKKSPDSANHSGQSFRLSNDERLSPYPPWTFQPVGFSIRRVWSRWTTSCVARTRIEQLDKGPFFTISRRLVLLFNRRYYADFWFSRAAEQPLRAHKASSKVVTFRRDSLLLFSPLTRIPLTRRRSSSEDVRNCENRILEPARSNESRSENVFPAERLFHRPTFWISDERNAGILENFQRKVFLYSCGRGRTRDWLVARSLPSRFKWSV